MLGKPRILSLFPTRFINSIKHEHSCKIQGLITVPGKLKPISDQSLFKLIISDQTIINLILPIYVHFNGQTFSGFFEQFSFTSKCLRLKCKKSTFLKKKWF